MILVEVTVEIVSGVVEATAEVIGDVVEATAEIITGNDGGNINVYVNEELQETIVSTNLQNEVVNIFV